MEEEDKDEVGDLFSVAAGDSSSSTVASSARHTWRCENVEPEKALQMATLAKKRLSNRTNRCNIIILGVAVALVRKVMGAFSKERSKKSSVVWKSESFWLAEVRVFLLHRYRACTPSGPTNRPSPLLTHEIKTLVVSHVSYDLLRYHSAAKVGLIFRNISNLTQTVRYGVTSYCSYCSVSIMYGWITCQPAIERP